MKLKDYIESMKMEETPKENNTTPVNVQQQQPVQEQPTDQDTSQQQENTEAPQN
ncbi:MAG: hypothetical protein KatS3mg035_0748 [Bacteroidia bacterium]|nr:MAG: hypothetical protein KatS3mg035_0748 [Bacteroidia bacterium]